jgi:cubilin
VLSFSGVPGCGGLLTEASGQFSSPSHPETYQHNLDCEWVIRANGNNDRIKLAFVSFDLEAHSGCRHGPIINQIRKGF